MMRRHSRTGILILAILCTLASAVVQRVGPTHLVEGEGFCPGPDPCRVPALGAGFPLAWLVDNPQISVPNSVSIAEDDFRPMPFVIDTAIYFVLLTCAAWLIRRRRDPVPH